MQDGSRKRAAAKRLFSVKKFTVRDIKSAQSSTFAALAGSSCISTEMPASENVFEPAVATYEQLNGKHTQYPIRDIFTNPRVYFCRYDITALLKDGENLLSAQLGNGWFNQTRVLNEGTFYIGSAPASPFPSG